MEMSDTSNGMSDMKYRMKSVRVIGGKSLEDWYEFARRDDCLDQMVPSQLRSLINAIPKE